MIKANELRIGNLVKNGLGEFIIIKNNINERNTGGYILKTLEPVPLTEEWLIKFGFINDEEIGYSWYIEWEGCVILAYDLDDKGIRVSDTWEFGKREYVHQLQNLYFALTGCELQYVA
jgi:hypothetical protein